MASRAVGEIWSKFNADRGTHLAAMIAYAFAVPGWGAGLLHYEGAELIDLEEPAPRTRTGTPGAQRRL